ncbi:hypothetical protein GCM10029964_120730 [Kibdelosporangium lantanae]
MTRYGYVIAKVQGSDGTHSVYAVEGEPVDANGRAMLRLRYVGRTVPGRRRDANDFTPDPNNIAGAVLMPADLYSPFSLPF